MPYHDAYAFALGFQGRCRKQKATAHRFAMSCQRKIAKLIPILIAVLLNSLVILLIGTVRFRDEIEKGPDPITAVVDTEGFFVRTTPAPAPTSGGGSPAATVADQAAQMVMNSVPSETPKVDVSAITTPTPAPFIIDVPRVSASTAQVVQKMARTITANAQSAASQGSGSGHGNNNGSGTYQAGGLTLPKGERVWLVIDASSSMQKHGRQVAGEVEKHANTTERKGVDSSLTYNWEHIVEGAQRGYKVIIWITDLAEHHQKEAKHWESINAGNIPTGLIRKGRFNIPNTYEAFQSLKKALEGSDTRLYIISVEFEANPELQQIVRSTGGSISIINE